jgi:hypothetical protein
VDRSSDDPAAAAGVGRVGAGRVGAGRVVAGMVGLACSRLIGGGAAGVRVLDARGGAALRALVDTAAEVAWALARPATKSAMGEWAGRTGRARRRKKARSERLAARSGAE